MNQICDQVATICDHKTYPTGKRDEKYRVITKCILCGKEFVINPSKRKD